MPTSWGFLLQNMAYTETEAHRYASDQRWTYEYPPTFTVRDLAPLFSFYVLVLYKHRREEETNDDLVLGLTCLFTK
jgi:hypothetical protein